VKIRRRYTIELYEETDSVNFYTIRFDGEEATEFDKFISEFMEKKGFEKDLQIITKWIDNIGQRGALERYLRPESKMSDDVSAIPIEVSKLRLYCLRISDNILILGNGGHKPKNQKTYNTDPHLNNCVETLANLDKQIKARKNQNRIIILGKTISGDLCF
jgi:hypothetical protein